MRKPAKFSPRLYLIKCLFLKRRMGDEKKMLNSPCLFLVELLASNGEIMFCKSVNGKSQGECSCGLIFEKAMLCVEERYC